MGFNIKGIELSRSGLNQKLYSINKQRKINKIYFGFAWAQQKLNSFFYGNPMPETPEVVRIYPFLCSKMHPGVQFIDCTFAT